MPEVKMGNYKKIKVKRKPVKVDPKNVDETIQMVMDRYAEWKDVDRKAGEGDRAEVDFEGFDKEDKAIPDTASKNHPVILGSGTMVPGFEDGIIGMSKEETKEQKCSRKNIAHHYGSDKFEGVVKNYIKKYGFPNDWGTLILMIDHKDPKIVIETLRVLKEVMAKSSVAEQEGFKSKVKILAMTAENDELREFAEEIVEELA